MGPEDKGVLLSGQGNYFVGGGHVSSHLSWQVVFLVIKIARQFFSLCARSPSRSTEIERPPQDRFVLFQVPLQQMGSGLKNISSFSFFLLFFFLGGRGQGILHRKYGASSTMTSVKWHFSLLAGRRCDAGISHGLGRSGWRAGGPRIRMGSWSPATGGS